MRETLRILWMNWRDIRHPLAGGAEVYTHEVAKRLAARGHEIILATSRPPGLPQREEIDGYTVIRRGGRLTVYTAARKTYHELKKQGWRPDIVIDEINTIPFMTPLYVKEPIAVLIYQLCRDCWKYAISPAVQPIGWTIERTIHKYYARKTREKRIAVIITISESTRRDLVSLGYPEEKTAIVPVGLDWSIYKDCINYVDAKDSLVVYIGRIAGYKKLDDLIKAWRIVEEASGAKLVIAGRPDTRYLKKLKKLAEKLQIKNIEFRTNIPEKDKLKLLAKAKLQAFTSPREGWGIAILEAAACKTPTVAYDAPGVRDAIVNMETGILVPLSDIEALAQSIKKLLEDNSLREQLAEKAYTKAKNHTWSTTAERFETILKEVMNNDDY